MSIRQAMLALLSEGPQYGLRLREGFGDAELLRLDSVVRWLDVADVRLERPEPDPAPGPESLLAPGETR